MIKQLPGNPLNDISAASGNHRQPPSLEELVGALAIQMDVITLMLIRKGIFSKEEFLEVLKCVGEDRNDKEE